MSTVPNDLEAAMIRRLDRVEQDLRRTREELEALLPVLRKLVSEIEPALRSAASPVRPKPTNVQ